MSRGRTNVAAATIEWPRGFVAPAKSARLAPLLEKGKRVLWTGHADVGSALRTQMGLWWLGMPWTIGGLLLIAFNVLPHDWRFLVLVAGGVFLAAPFLLACHAAGAVYAITDRRAIIRRDALGQKQTVCVPFEEMDEELEVMTTSGATGHLYFASNMSTKLADADYDGRLSVPRASSRAGGRRPARPCPQARHRKAVSRLFHHPGLQLGPPGLIQTAYLPRPRPR